MGEAGIEGDASRRSTCRFRTLHVANVGGVHERGGHPLAEMGHTVRGQTRRRRCRSSSRCAPWGSTWPPGPTCASRCPLRSRPWSPSTGHPGRRPRRGGGRAAGAPVLQLVGGAGRHLAAAHHAGGGGHFHGSTTTSALLATILEATGRKPGWVVGAGVAGLGRSAAWGGDGPLVVEADESDGTSCRWAPTRPSSPTWRPTTSNTGAGSRPCAPASSASWPPSTGRRCCASTTPAPRA